MMETGSKTDRERETNMYKYLRRLRRSCRQSWSIETLLFIKERNIYLFNHFLTSDKYKTYKCCAFWKQKFNTVKKHKCLIFFFNWDFIILHQNNFMKLLNMIVSCEYIFLKDNIFKTNKKQLTLTYNP